MNNPTIEALIAGLGLTYKALVANETIGATPIIEVFEGSESQYTVPANGIEIGIDADSGIVSKISIHILEDDDEIGIFEGAIPEHYAGRTQIETRERLGNPLESRGYNRLPYPLPPTGGWDKYEIDAEATPPKYLYVTYNTEMVVRRLTFALPYTDD
ncbi:hypothetical protein SFA35_06360 [Pseudomonas sp. HR96]|uniref:hypothetical protein n=1 Tax=Pseudomonas sp. HR96 TaxID=1027966 RepID=UPI002A7524E0|nr:hypothetical protein [Pseudomonas sp. HR96]WPP00982.1 hypothetical protein SFA35_06360 [Pseudomonas sp. HR96]